MSDDHIFPNIDARIQHYEDVLHFITKPPKFLSLGELFPGWGYEVIFKTLTTVVKPIPLVDAVAELTNSIPYTEEEIVNLGSFRNHLLALFRSMLLAPAYRAYFNERQSKWTGATLKTIQSVRHDPDVIRITATLKYPKDSAPTSFDRLNLTIHMHTSMTDKSGIISMMCAIDYAICKLADPTLESYRQAPLFKDWLVNYTEAVDFSDAMDELYLTLFGKKENESDSGVGGEVVGLQE